MTTFATFARSTILASVFLAPIAMTTVAHATPVLDATASQLPTITGKPATTVTIATEYSFTPTATQTVKSRMKFDIQNQPSWAQFNTVTAPLNGLNAGDLCPGSAALEKINASLR